MPYSFNPFSGNFDNTPSTTEGDSAYSTLKSASGDWVTYNDVYSTFLPLTGGTLSGNLFIGDQEGTTTLFISGNKVGINNEIPNEALTVVGNISATGTIYASNVNSEQWNSVYSNVNSNSATNWDNELSKQYTHANFLPLSGGSITGSLCALSDFRVGTGVIDFVITEEGNVGIKTETPNEVLTVVGNVSATGFYYGNGSNLSGILPTPPSTGTYILKSIDGIIQWVV